MPERSIASLWPNRPRGIILAADLDSLSATIEFVSLAAEVSAVVAVKVGFTLALRHGLCRAVEAIQKRARVPVIYDHQKAGTDIPRLGEPFMAACQEAGVDAVILFPHAGPRTLESWVAAARNFSLVPIVGVTMTHEAYLSSEGGYIDDKAPASICATSLKIGVKDFALPGTKPDIVAHYASGPLAGESDVSILMPGIGSQGGDMRIAFSAAQPHRRYAIIGSGIYSAADPKTALLGFGQQV
jgi:orotidine-5'-phosphate decarboxylase